jgi:hypothetical protein
MKTAILVGVIAGFAGFVITLIAVFTILRVTHRLETPPFNEWLG